MPNRPAHRGGVGAGRWTRLALLAAALTASAAPADAQEIRVSRISVERVGFAGRVRMERWIPMWIGVQAKGNDDAAVQIEVVDRDLDADRVHYRRSTFVRELRSRPIEVYFRPRQRGARPQRHDIAVLVRDEATREVLARENVSFAVSWAADPGPPLAGNLYAAEPHRRLAAFLNTGGPEFAPESPGSGAGGSFQEFLKLFDPLVHDENFRVRAAAKDDGLFVSGAARSGLPPGGPREVGPSAHRRFMWVDVKDDDLPSAGFALEALDVIFWAPTGREDLAPAKRRALAEWVAGGGRLVVFVGRTWMDVRNNFPFKPLPANPGEVEGSPAPTGLLPVSFGPDVPGAPDPALFSRTVKTFLGADAGRFTVDQQRVPKSAEKAPEYLQAFIAPMTLRPLGEMVGFSQVRSLADYRRPDRPEFEFTLIADSRFGAGGVTAVAFNPGETALRNAYSVKAVGVFWSHLLHHVGLTTPVRETHAQQWLGAERFETSGADYLIKADGGLDRALEDFRLPGVGPGTVLLLLIVYGILVGPAMWFALKATNMLRWSWPVFAVLVIGATILSYTAVTVLRGVRTHRNRLTVVDVPAEGGPTAGWHFDSIYSPLDGEFRLVPPARGWIAPWSPVEDDDIGAADLAGDTYFENLNPSAAAATELFGVPIRNHVKKFLSRWIHGRPVGRLEVARLHAVFDDPTRITEPVPRQGFWDRENETYKGDVPNRPYGRVQRYRRVVRIEFQVRNNLDFDLEDGLLFVWPRAVDAPPRMIVAHRHPPTGLDVAVDPHDFSGTIGAVVLPLGRIEKGRTISGAAHGSAPGMREHAVGTGRPAPNRTFTELREWLAAHAGRFPVTGHTGSAADWRIDETAVTAALLSIQQRLIADPAQRSSWQFGGRADAEVDYRKGPTPDRDFSSPRRSLAVRVGSPAFLDASGALRPDEALLVARAAGPVEVPTATVQSARGTDLRPVERAAVIIRTRLALSAEVFAVPETDRQPPGR